jgi:hypothetical protein
MFSKLAAKQFDTMKFPSLKRGRKTLQGERISKAIHETSGAAERSLFR